MNDAGEGGGRSRRNTTSAGRAGEMTDADRLYAAILAHPDEDAPRLMWADEVEYADPARAEFVRVQVELAKRPWMGAKANDPRYRWPEPWESLRRRERELWGLGEPTCPHTLPHDFDYHTDATVSRASGRNPVAVVRRGFVDEVRLTARAFFGVPCETCDGSGGRCVNDDNPDGLSDIGWFDPDQAGYCAYCGHLRAGHVDCPACGGTGRTPGLAGPLFAAHPITKVVLTGKRPGRPEYDDGWAPAERGWYAADRDEPDEPDDIPPEIHTLLRGGRVDLNADGRPSRWRVYPTEADALAALPPACVEYGRAG